MAVAVGLGTVGIAAALLSDGRLSLRAVSVASWTGALLVFTTASQPRGEAQRTVLVGVAAASASVLAEWAWPLALFALAAWTWTARLAGLGWQLLLVAGCGFVVAAAVAVAMGRPGGSEVLALLGYGLACVACTLAVVTGLER